MKAHGWAVVEGGEIDIRTVSPTPLAAVVKWLVTAKGHPICAYTPDHAIQLQWQRWHGSAKLVRVTIDLQPTTRTDDPASAFGA